MTRSLWDRWGRVAAVIAIATAGGCYESDVPLDPKPQRAVDEAWLGTWRCLPQNADADEDPVTVTVERGSEGRYGITWLETGKAPERYEAFASSVRGTTFLNVREMKADGPSGKWVFLRPTLLRPGILQAQIIDRDALKGVDSTAPALRRAIERQLSSTALTMDFCVCVRAREATDQSGQSSR